MQILITGVAGFIGFNLSKLLLKKKNIKIIGIDNINSYYSQSLKKDRIKELKKYKNFTFKKVDLKNLSSLEKIFSKKISIIINLAAQAGVRYSIKNPREFVNNNILGFYNLIDLAQKYKIKKIMYASSSSIYGDSKKFPLNETQNVSPKNIYALSKKNNEDLASIFSSQYNIKFIGLRFFTVYGEWGRPDMFMMKYLTSCYNHNKKFYLNNFGNHTRDFTYIQDVCNLVEKLIFYKNKLKSNEVFNICSNNPVKLMDIVTKLNNLTLKKPRLHKRKLQEADVVKTHGNNKKVMNLLGKINFTSIDSGLKNTVVWFKKYYNL